MPSRLCIFSAEICGFCSRASWMDLFREGGHRPTVHGVVHHPIRLTRTRIANKSRRSEGIRHDSRQTYNCCCVMKFLGTLPSLHDVHSTFDLHNTARQMRVLPAIFVCIVRKRAMFVLKFKTCGCVYMVKTACRYDQHALRLTPHSTSHALTADKQAALYTPIPQRPAAKQT